MRAARGGVQAGEVGADGLLSRDVYVDFGDRKGVRDGGEGGDEEDGASGDEEVDDETDRA